MKKLLAFLLGIMVMATMISGCGGGDKKDDKNLLHKNSLTLLPAVLLVLISR